MSDSDYPSPEPAEEHDRLPDDLPPVEPPSAGFIVQLFLVPALIVMVIVGVWALFGKLAAGEQDWRVLVAEVRNNNELRRWRGALGLAQMLNVDRQLGDAGQHLATNREIATELSELLDERLASSSQSDEDIKQQSFLTLTLGSLDVPDVVLPTLQKAMGPTHDRDVRKNAVGAVALIAGRAQENGQTIDDPQLVESLIAVSTDENALLRQMGAFALGLVPSEASHQRLLVLLNDSNHNTQVNAAVALARQDSAEGLPVFRDVLTEAATEKSSAPPQDETEAAEQSSQDTGRLIALKNTVKAVGDLANVLESEERTDVIGLLEPIAADHPENRIRIDAQQAIGTLNQAQ